MDACDFFTGSPGKLLEKENQSNKPNLSFANCMLDIKRYVCNLAKLWAFEGRFKNRSSYKN